MKVFIVMDTTMENTRRESIIGVFQSLEKAKIALADYVLSDEINMLDTYFVDILEFEVE